jgi:hypothetical protein
MRPLIVCVTMSFAGMVFGSGQDNDHIRKQFKSDNYKVSWGTARNFDLKAELEIGYGNGHGFTLGWMRFQPGKDGVDVLSVKLDEGRNPYQSKWPPDLAPVAVEHVRMKSDAYAVLLRDWPSSTRRNWSRSYRTPIPYPFPRTVSGCIADLPQVRIRSSTSTGPAIRVAAKRCTTPSRSALSPSPSQR